MVMLCATSRRWWNCCTFKKVYLKIKKLYNALLITSSCISWLCLFQVCSISAHFINFWISIRWLGTISRSKICRIWRTRKDGRLVRSWVTFLITFVDSSTFFHFLITSSSKLLKGKSDEVLTVEDDSVHILELS